MSTYEAETKNPRTGEWEQAWWFDNYFGRHHYGVRFPSGLIIDPEQERCETRPALSTTEPGYGERGDG